MNASEEPSWLVMMIEHDSEISGEHRLYSNSLEISSVDKVTSIVKVSVK